MLVSGKAGFECRAEGGQLIKNFWKRNNWSSLFYLKEIQSSNFGLGGKGKMPTAPGHIAQGVQTISITTSFREV